MNTEPARTYRAREGVYLEVSGLAGSLRKFLSDEKISPIAWVHLDFYLLSAVFSHFDAERIIAWMTKNGIMDEDYVADLAAEAGA